LLFYEDAMRRGKTVLIALPNDESQAAGPTRGYQFFGTGTSGGLLVADTCPTSHGGPNGIRAVVGQDLSFTIRGMAIRH
jgi:hypothetical protein